MSSLGIKTGPALVATLALFMVIMKKTRLGLEPLEMVLLLSISIVCTAMQMKRG